MTTIREVCLDRGKYVAKARKVQGIARSPNRVHVNVVLGSARVLYINEPLLVWLFVTVFRNDFFCVEFVN